MAEVTQMEDWAAAYLRRASKTYLRPNRVEQKHALELMKRGHLNPVGDNPFKATAFSISNAGLAALKYFDAAKAQHNRDASDCGFLPAMIRELDEYSLSQDGERAALCEAAIAALHALEIPFRK